MIIGNRQYDRKDKHVFEEIHPYKSPKTKVVFMKMHSILCISNPDANTTEMKEGDDNW